MVSFIMHSTPNTAQKAPRKHAAIAYTFLSQLSSR